MSTPSNPQVLALIALDEQAAPLLKEAVAIANTLQARLKIVHVKEPSKAIRQDNAFSAKKELYDDYLETLKQLKDLLSEPREDMEFRLIYGHVRNSVLDAMQEIRPEVVVMGKRVKKLAGLLGDRLSDAVLDAAPGSVLMVAAEVGIQGPDVGVYATGSEVELGPWQSVLQQQFPKRKYFSIGKADVRDDANTDPDHYVFSDDGDAMGRLISFADKTRAGLFCIPKGTDKSVSRRLAGSLRSSVLVVQ